MCEDTGKYSPNMLLLTQGHHMSKDKKKKTVAVLIDEENVSVDALSWLFGQLTSLGNIEIKRAYAKWATGTLKRRQDTLQSLGIEPIDVVEGSQRGKNSSDIRLAIDAIDLLHEESLDIFVIVSGDSDFRPVVDRIRRSGKTVYGAGRTKVASKTLVETYDKYFDLDSSRVVTSRQNSGVTTEKPQTALPSTTKNQAQNANLERMVVRSIEEVQSTGEQVTGARLHQHIKKLDTGFAIRKHGFSTFRKLLESLPSITTTSGKKGDMTVGLSKANVPPQARGDPAGEKIHQAWISLGKTKQGRKEIAGPVAATAAAKILGASKLSASEHKTLKRLIAGYPTLGKNWRHERNKIFSK